MHVLVAGCGWLGTALARALVARGDRVTGIRRDARRARELEAVGVTPLAVDLAEPAAESLLPGDLDAIVACQAARGDSIDAYRRAYVTANRTLLRACEVRPVRAFVYTGSTGVFGQDHGEDVDEVSPIAPTSPTASVLAEGEAIVREAAQAGHPTRILRLSGLYGPGRAGILERVRSGVLALGPGDETWMNFCHLDDAVGFTLAALDRGRSGAVYHGSDEAPARRRDVVAWIAERLGIPPGRRGVAIEPTRRGADRRISSARTRAELEYTLRFPSFRDGLVALLSG